MSYNIDRWQQTACALHIPKSAIVGTWEDNYQRLLDDNVIIDLPAEDAEITGVWNAAKDGVDIKQIQFRGSGSGHGFPDLIDFLKSTKGTYSAWMVWEGGDSFSVINIDNGNVEVTDLDLTILFAEHTAMMNFIVQFKKVAGSVFDPSAICALAAFTEYERKMEAIKNAQT